jgi:hypothetical protein
LLPALFPLACSEPPPALPPSLPSTQFSGWFPQAEERFYTHHLPRAEQRPWASLLLPLRGLPLPEPGLERARRDEQYATWRLYGQADLDGDGALERWSAVEIGGSGGAIYEITVERDGDGPLMFTLMTGSGSSNLSGGSLPRELATDAAVRFWSAAFWGEDHLRSTRQIHGAFGWLLEERAQRGWLLSVVPFRERIGWSPFWTPGHPQPLRDEVLAVPEPAGGVSLHAFYGSSFDPPERVCALGSLELYRTGDALAVYDPARDASSWVYVAEGEYKAPTLGEAWCAGELVALTVRPGLWLLDPRSGRRGQIDLAGAWPHEVLEGLDLAELQRLLAQ